MMLGCGYCEKIVHGRPYLYVWHYEFRGGRREQVEEYVGPARNPRARQDVATRIAAYADRAQAELAGFVRKTRAAMASA